MIVRNTDGSSTTSIKGVMRVGLVAKGLLLQGDNMVHLVVLCAEKPTRSLLTRVVDALSKHLVVSLFGCFSVISSTIQLLLRGLVRYGWRCVYISMHICISSLSVPDAVMDTNE